MGNSFILLHMHEDTKAVGRKAKRSINSLVSLPIGQQCRHKIIYDILMYYSRNCIMMPKKRAKIEKYVEELKLKVVTWLGGICFPLRTSSSKVPKLYMTLSGVIRPAS